MSCIHAERLGFSYRDRVPLFAEVELHLSPGWYGLVGANGAGKTTFARLVAGELQPTSGRLRLHPRDASVVLCRQELEQPSRDMDEFLRNDSREAHRQRGHFGLDVASFGSLDRLSPGERKRWQLAAALSVLPDVLIVDEPTNHLDESGREELIGGLRTFRGIGILISHDRDLLDALTESTLRVHGGKITALPGNYSAARELWVASAQKAVEERERLRIDHARLRGRILLATRDKDAAGKQRTARHRMKNIHDHDGSSFARNERAANAEAGISRRIGVMSSELERIERTIPTFVEDKTLGGSVFVGYRSAPKRNIASMVNEDVTVAERTILHGVNLTLERDSRIHLCGPNGSGKTSLIRALLSRAMGSKARILYLPQELGTEWLEALRARVLQLDSTERGRIMAILAALGVDPARFIESNTCSPGEGRKFELAYGLATHVWAMVLDEPTNHLDLESIERLERALIEFPGALLVVTHDARFAERCTTARWEIQGGQVLTTVGRAHFTPL